MRPDVEVDVVEVITFLVALKRRIENTRRVLRAAQSLLEDESAARFASDGDGDWPDLDPDTIIRRRTEGITHKRVLDASGRLKRSLTGASRDAIRRIDRDTLTFGTRVPYAQWVATHRDPLPHVDRPLIDELGETMMELLMDTPP